MYLSYFHQYLWPSEQFCVHSKCPVSVCGVNERMMRQPIQGSSLDLRVATCLNSILQLWCRVCTWLQDPSSLSAHPSLSCTHKCR